MDELRINQSAENSPPHTKYMALLNDLPHYAKFSNSSSDLEQSSHLPDRVSAGLASETGSINVHMSLLLNPSPLFRH